MGWVVSAGRSAFCNVPLTLTRSCLSRLEQECRDEMSLLLQGKVNTRISVLLAYFQQYSLSSMEFLCSEVCM